MVQEVIERVKSHLEGVRLQKITDEQEVLLKNNYNCKLYFFEYGLSPKGDLVISTSSQNYKNLLYYIGFEWEKKSFLKLKIEGNDSVAVVLDMESKRVSELAKKLGLIRE